MLNDSANGLQITGPPELSGWKTGGSSPRSVVRLEWAINYSNWTPGRYKGVGMREQTTAHVHVVVHTLFSFCWLSGKMCSKWKFWSKVGWPWRIDMIGQPRCTQWYNYVKALLIVRTRFCLLKVISDFLSPVSTSMLFMKLYECQEPRVHTLILLWCGQSLSFLYHRLVPLCHSWMDVKNPEYILWSCFDVGNYQTLFLLLISLA